MTQIRLLLEEESDLGPHCLSMKLQIFQWMTKTYNFFVIFAPKGFINVSSVFIWLG